MTRTLARFLAGVALVAAGSGVAMGSMLPVTVPVPVPLTASAPDGLLPLQVHSQPGEPVPYLQADEPGWTCKSSDNICGLRDKRQLSNPAKIDWGTLLDETPEMKEMQKKGIDPSSPEGIRLKNKAESRLRAACEAEMDAGAYCSVWKDISHKDGRNIADLTDLVRARL